MAVRRARFKPTANLSIKRPASNNRPAILRAPKAEKEDGPPSAPPSPAVKIEPVAVPKQENVPKPTPPVVEPTVTNPQFLPPSRPSPAPSPVLSPAPPPPPRSPQPQPARSPAHVIARSPAHPSLSAMDDSLFKSPIMSPSYPPPLSRTPNPYAMKTMSPNPLLDSPGSPNKARPRIRPVPLIHPLHARRGEDDDIIRIPQRVRHMSTSSTTSVTKFVPQQVGRIRTESTCSAYSDVSVFKPRRSGRSDEYLRLCEARRDLLKKCNGDAPDKTQLRMYDMIYYNPKTNPMKRHLEEERPEGGGGGGKSKERRTSVSSAKSPTKSPPATPVKGEEPKKREEPQEPPAAMPVPQLKLGANGEMILDEKSLTIEMTGEREARERIANADIIYDDLNSSNGFYKRHTRTKDWPADETIRFYRCLQVIGTDFSLMNSLFPKRSRRDLKLKFKKEEKINGFLVNKALIEHTSFDIGQLEETFRKEEEEKEEEIRELQAAKEKALEAKTEVVKKLKQKRARGMSRAARAMDDQDLDLEKAPVHKLRQTKPRKVRRVPPKAEEQKDPVANAVPLSPASVPPASPCKTPNWPSSPLPAGRETPIRMPMPINLHDTNLSCTTRAQRKVSESRAATPIDITTAPKSVEIVQDELQSVRGGGEEKKPLPEILVTKKEKEDPKVTSEHEKVKLVAKETDKVREVEEEDGGDDEVEEEEAEDDEGGIDGLDLSNLVVLEAVNDRGEKTFNVHFMDRETEEMSEEPLDLPQEVIDYIVDTLDAQKAQKVD